MAARLVAHLNLGTLNGLPQWSQAPVSGKHIDFHAVKAAGFSGIQHYIPQPDAVLAGLDMTGISKIVLPEEALDVAERHARWGFLSSTWHVGTGLESDTEMDRLADAVLEASAATGLPIYIETHRATMTQDIRRTVDLIGRFPDLEFNADFSHWYTGLEMRYGDWEAKLDAIQPVIGRVRYIHGRIGNSSSMQIPLDMARSGRAWDDFSELWSRCFAASKAQKGGGVDIVFAPELLPARIDSNGVVRELNYAWAGRDGLELSDRWLEALALIRHAQTLFATEQLFESH